MIHTPPSGQIAPYAQRSIAIVTVCLNDLRGLQSTFESVRSQRTPPLQWIVADGGSTDGTVEWLRSVDWPTLDWSSKPDGGIYFGMNAGLRDVTADYVLFLNSGDTLAGPDVLDKVADSLAMLSERPSLLYGDCFVVEGNGAEWFRRARHRRWSPIGMPTSHQAMVFRTDSISDGFDTTYSLSADYAAVLRLYAAHRGSDFEYVPVALCRYKLGGRSEQQRRRGIREEFEIRQRILGMGPIPAMLLHAAHHVQGWIKRHVPVLHRLMRYG